MAEHRQSTGGTRAEPDKAWGKHEHGATLALPVQFAHQPVPVPPLRCVHMQKKNAPAGENIQCLRELMTLTTGLFDSKQNDENHCVCFLMRTNVLSVG